MGGSKITADGDCSPEIKGCLLLERKAMTNLDSILKSRDITLPTKVHLVKAMVFPVVMYGCESWTIKKAEVLASAAHILKWNDTEKIAWPLHKDDMQIRKVFHVFKKTNKLNPPPKKNFIKINISKTKKKKKKAEH